MKILIVGNAGREHALLWKLKHDAPGADFYITGGNGGTESLATSLPIAQSDGDALASWAAAEGIDLTVVGPEAPLAAGLVDRFSARGLAAFGPTAAAAEIESSKAFAKALMARHGIPTAAHRTFRDLAEAEAYIRAHPAPVVVKASGLASGKGALVCATTEEALEAAREMLGRGGFGAAGDEVVVEEFMEGEELSVFAITDGRDVLPMLAAQDHKRIGEGDTGPNTGGMGAYAPVSIATPEVMERVEREVLRPTVAAMAEAGRPFRGLLYAGLMLTREGPKVVEFNARFGDPETQALIPLLESSLLEPLLEVARGGSIAGASLAWRAGAAVTTVLAAGGYPEAHATGRAIEIAPEVERADDVLVFHGRTARDASGRLTTAGGRVLAVTGVADSLGRAAERSRWGCEQIRFEECYWRRDIGWREIGRSQAAARTAARLAVD